MANVRTFELPHYPQYPVHVALFKNVTNAAFLRSQLLEANPAFDYAFLDASMILSPTHLLSASILALHLSLTSRLKARTAHSELVFRLHPNNNIGESYRKFGISDSTSTLIAVKLGLSEDVTNESVSRHLGESVKGDSVGIGEDGVEVGGYCDLGAVRKVYKLDGGGGGGSAGKGKGKKGVVNGGTNGEVNAMDERKEVEAVVLGMMTIKGS